MSSEQNRNMARLLAPIALGLCALALFATVLASAGGDDEGGDTAPTVAGERATRTAGTTTAETSATQSGVYTVATGDTLAEIAAKVGLTVAQLQELNPELDPQALVSGQKIKLRE
jgi:LysM repeat protein